jgi:hypothetical protein
VKWASSTDVSNPLLGQTCVRLEEPLPGSGWREWAGFYKLLRLIEALPPI